MAGVLTSGLDRSATLPITHYNIAIPYFWASVQRKVNKIRKKHTFGRVGIRAQGIEMTGA